MGAQTWSHSVSMPVPSMALHVVTTGSPPAGTGAARRQLWRGPLARVASVAVGLVDGDHVGELEDALLDALQLVAGAGRASSTRKKSTMLGDGRLALADADGLDEHDVEAGGLDESIVSRVAARRRRACRPSATAG